MRLDSAHLEQARMVADAILYEGYLLYPYRRSAQKNQTRFQFGVLVPPAYQAVDECERTASQTECLLEAPDEAEILVLVRFLQLQHRVVQAAGPGELHDVDDLEVDGTEYTPWEEATERQQQTSASVGGLLRQDRKLEFHIGSGERAEDITDAEGRLAGRLIRRWSALDGVVQLSAERVAGPYGALRLRVRVENHTEPGVPLRIRDDSLPYAMIAAHELIGVPGGKFLSLTDPPEWAAAEAAACVNTGTWPVLAGSEDCRDLMLSSPVILYDHPEVAAESAGDLFDATEIDEILTLRTMALTDAEKRQARATDPRAAEIMDRLDDMPAEMLERMHGAIRYLRSVPAGARVMPPHPQPPAVPGDDFDPILDRPQVPWWDPGSDSSVSPETDHVVIAGVKVARGSKVRMHPGSRRADAQDLFLVGRTAEVEAVLNDVDGQVHVAVTPEDDPAADLQRSHGRFLYFAPDELEPIDPGPP
ncbi:MAG TPA: hypothetical protein VGJ50_29495 [Streptosporangiaceae bacterium]